MECGLDTLARKGINGMGPRSYSCRKLPNSRLKSQLPMIRPFSAWDLFRSPAGPKWAMCQCWAPGWSPSWWVSSSMPWQNTFGSGQGCSADPAGATSGGRPDPGVAGSRWPSSSLRTPGGLRSRFFPPRNGISGSTGGVDRADSRQLPKTHSDPTAERSHYWSPTLAQKSASPALPPPIRFLPTTAGQSSTV